MKEENQIKKIVAEAQGIQHLLRQNRNLSFSVIRGLNKELEMRKEMLQGIIH